MRVFYRRVLKVEIEYSPECLRDDDEGVWSLMELVVGAVVSTESQDSYLSGLSRMTDPRAQQVVRQLIDTVLAKIADKSLFTKGSPPPSSSSVSAASTAAPPQKAEVANSETKQTKPSTRASVSFASDTDNHSSGSVSTSPVLSDLSRNSIVDWSVDALLFCDLHAVLLTSYLQGEHLWAGGSVRELRHSEGRSVRLESAPTTVSACLLYSASVLRGTIS